MPSNRSPRMANLMRMAERHIDSIAVTVPLDPYLTLRALAAYSGISVRKLREYLADSFNPLPCYRIGGKVLIRRSEFDRWISVFRQAGRADVDRIANEVLGGL